MAVRFPADASGLLAVSAMHSTFCEALEARRLFSTVAVNLKDVNQTIAGIGGDYAEGAITGQITGVAQDPVGDLTLQYLSPTEARVGLPLPLWAPTQGGAYSDHGVVHEVFTLLQQLQAKGIQITLTSWNIPDWMASNPTASSQREIATDMYGAYADAVAAFVKRAKGSYGVNISYYSVNEADGGYNVLLSESQETELIKSVGSAFKADGLKTKWLVGDTSNLDAAVPYISAILSHASVLPYVGAISYHTWYSDGLPDSSFAAVATLAKKYDVPVFATEIGVGPIDAPATTTWDFAADLAEAYHKVLGPGGVDVALDWEFQNDDPVATTGGTVYPAFDVLQQMDNTFTPGTEVIGATPSDSSLLSLAALNPKTGAFAVQVQNTSDSAEEVTLSGLPIATYSLIQTSEAAAEADMGKMKTHSNGTITVTLPAASFSTFTTSKVWTIGDPVPALPAVGPQLTGTASANTTGSYDGTSTFADAFDGNLDTYFDAPTADGNWIQLDLGSPKSIAEIEYAPRIGYEDRMLGGVFEVSNNATFSSGVKTVGTITSTPQDGFAGLADTLKGAFRYLRYVAPANSYGNIAELKVFGPVS